MSLFVGNISRSVTQSDIESTFKEFGACTVNFKGSFAFVEFDDQKEGDEAFEALQNKQLGGRPINLEWSKKSKKFDSSKHDRRRRKDDSPKRSEGRCYNCGSKGHFLRDCK